MKEFTYIKQSIKWTKRDLNKDSVLVIDKNDYSCFFLFDWVSSSKNAKDWIKIVKKFIRENIERYNKEDWFYFKKLVIDSNNYLLKHKIDDWLTTISCVYLSKVKDDIKIVNVGDSRIYGIFKQFKKQFTIDDKDVEYSNIITKCLWIDLIESDISEHSLSYSDIEWWRLLLCSDWFYSIFEDNKVLFHQTLLYDKLWNIKNKLYKEIKGKNIDDSTYIYVIIK